jgi:hypothetical protein
MRHVTRRPARSLTALLAAATLVLAGCGDDEESDTGETADATETAVDDEDGGDDGDGDGEADDDGDGGEDADDGGSGEATWMGEALDVERVSCTAGRPEPDIFQIRASGDGFDLTAQLLMDGAASDPDDVELAGDEVDVDLFFQGEGGTIGDGEGYSSGRSDDDGSGLDGGVDGVSGTVELGPDMSSRASEVNPDGGTLELDLRC